MLWAQSTTKDYIRAATVLIKPISGPVARQYACVVYAVHWAELTDSGLNNNTWVRTHGLSAHPQRNLPLFLKTTRPRAFFTLEEPSGLAKETCSYEGTDWLRTFASQRMAERSIIVQNNHLREHRGTRWHCTSSICRCRPRAGVISEKHSPPD